MTLFLVLSMVFLHIVDDFCLQPIILNKLKQKSWWEQNAPNPLYRYDYIMALLMHSLSWCFMTMLPVAYSMNFDITGKFLLAFAVNTLIHGLTDHIKANKGWINLITDQGIHLVQIAITASIFT